MTDLEDLHAMFSWKEAGLVARMLKYDLVHYPDDDYPWRVEPHLGSWIKDTDCLTCAVRVMLAGDPEVVAGYWRYDNHAGTGGK